MRHFDFRLGEPAKHFWLTRSSARAMGVNLSEAMAAGRLTSHEYCQLVTRCRGCAWVDECQGWLADQAVVRGEAYGECMNKGLLESLQ